MIPDDSTNLPDALELRVYQPRSILRSPAKLFSDMWRDLRNSRELAWRLLVRDISARYRQSFLGLFWAFIPPVMMAVVLLMARRANVINIGETDIPYPAYVMLSMVLWQTFTESILSPITALQQAKPMLAKINFPHEALMLAKFGDVLFNFGIKLLLIVSLYIYFGLEFGWGILLVPFVILTIVAFGFFLGILLAPIGGLYTDISKGLTIVTGLWLFLTPVIYPPPQSGLFSVVVNVNPMTHLLVTARELATDVAVSNPGYFILYAMIAWIGLIFAWVVFRVSIPVIIERMSA